VSLAANRWLTVRLEFFSNLLVAATAVLAVVNSLVGSSAAGQRANLAGLALTYAPGLTDTLNFLIRQFTQLETMMVSVERMLSYSGLVAEKAVTASPPQLVAPEWPSNGAIEFRDVCMRYRDHLPDVLKGCSVRIGGGEKMGIVGRTGAGKSSILVALFRMSELRGGSILIDGVDIAAVELPTLRGRLAIIPQDPVLFTGTLRSNIDPNPAKSYEDADLWDVLRQCGMETSMAEHPKGLERPMEERGGNLSMGQRQLCGIVRFDVSLSASLLRPRTQGGSGLACAGFASPVRCSGALACLCSTRRQHLWTWSRTPSSSARSRTSSAELRCSRSHIGLVRSLRHTFRALISLLAPLLRLAANMPLKRRWDLLVVAAVCNACRYDHALRSHHGHARGRSRRVGTTRDSQEPGGKSVR
jgi:ABC-type ATPase involved in cell division